MADVVLFHHVQGLTAGVHRLAGELRAGGHTVHTPDFFEGATFDSIDDGFAAMRARGEPLDVVEQHDVGHLVSPILGNCD